MSYLEEFQALSDGHNPSKFLRLWEEYCQADTVDGPELIRILDIVKKSSLAPVLGEYAETVLPLWKQIQDGRTADTVLRLVVDLETTNNPLFADLALEYLKKKYSHHKFFNEILRIVGLRSRQNFQGAISNFELLVHMDKGRFVFHTGGWGVGEIIEVSVLREHVLIEFEGLSSLKDLHFENALKTLIPLPNEHFLARRFGNPDLLEKEGKEDPVALIHLLLKDLGPKTASEIKDELCDLVIPEAEWTKWWQSARSKLKRDTKIRSPEGTKEPFVIREEELSHNNRFHQALKEVKSTEKLIQTLYNFLETSQKFLKIKKLKNLSKSS